MMKNHAAALGNSGIEQVGTDGHRGGIAEQEENRGHQGAAADTGEAYGKAHESAGENKDHQV